MIKFKMQYMEFCKIYKDLLCYIISKAYGSGRLLLSSFCAVLISMVTAPFLISG